MSTPLAPRTVVEALLPLTGDASLADVYDIANLAGIDDQPVRLAIRRMMAAGDVEQHGRGRAGTLRLTAAGLRRLHADRQGLALAFAQDAGLAPWDGRWRLTAVSVPERERAVRDTVRRELAALGAVAVSTGLYVSPHDLTGLLGRDAAPYLTTATSDDLDLRGTTDPRAIAERLWPAAPVVAAYAAVEDALHADADDDSPVVVRRLRLADALERAMRDDPLLPVELRVGAWAPTAARTDWARRWETLDEGGDSRVYRGWWPPRATTGSHPSVSTRGTS